MTGCRISRGLVGFLAALVATAPALAAADRPEEIPPLRPPRGEIAPGFWEQHGLLVAAGAALLLIVLGLIVWLLLRPRAPARLAPAAAARQALAALRALPEDGAVLSLVSQVLRRYCQAAFALPSEEMTTTEFCRALGSHERVGPELAAAIGGFLRGCDERKFAPQETKTAGLRDGRTLTSGGAGGVAEKPPPAGGSASGPGACGTTGVAAPAEGRAPNPAPSGTGLQTGGAVEEALRLVAAAEARLAQTAPAAASQPPAAPQPKPTGR